MNVFTIFVTLSLLLVVNCAPHNVTRGGLEQWAEHNNNVLTWAHKDIDYHNLYEFTGTIEDCRNRLEKNGYYVGVYSYGQRKCWIKNHRTSYFRWVLWGANANAKQYGAGGNLDLPGYDVRTIEADLGTAGSIVRNEDIDLAVCDKTSDQYTCWLKRFRTVHDRYLMMRIW